MSSVADRFTKEAAKNASLFDWRNFADESIKRQFRNIAEQGTSAMSNTTKLERVSTDHSQWKYYSLKLIFKLGLASDDKCRNFNLARDCYHIRA